MISDSYLLTLANPCGHYCDGEKRFIAFHWSQTFNIFVGPYFALISWAFFSQKINKASKPLTYIFNIAYWIPIDLYSKKEDKSPDSRSILLEFTWRITCWYTPERHFCRILWRCLNLQRESPFTIKSIISPLMLGIQ